MFSFVLIFLAYITVDVYGAIPQSSFPSHKASRTQFILETMTLNVHVDSLRATQYNDAAAAVPSV